MKPPVVGGPSALAVSGGVELLCGADDSGRLLIKRQRFQPPVHLGKAYFDDESNTLLVHLACPTAGLLEGDELTCDVTIEKGGSLVLTTPGSTRAHFMRSGLAKVRQRFQIEDGGFLEFAPETLILQRASRLLQDTTVSLAPEAELLFLESIAPGRVASGEVFEFDEFTNRFRVEREGSPVVLERFRVRSDAPDSAPWRSAFPTPYYAAFHLFSPKLEEQLSCRRAIHDLQSENLLAGATRLHHGGWTVKLLAADSVTLRQAIAFTRQRLYEELGRVAPSFRRY